MKIKIKRNQNLNPNLSPNKSQATLIFLNLKALENFLL